MSGRRPRSTSSNSSGDGSGPHRGSAGATAASSVAPEPSRPAPPRRQSSSALPIPELTPQQRNIVVAKKMFYGGCMLLPWLWIVNVMYFWREMLGGTNAPRELVSYVRKSALGGFLFAMAFVMWTVVFQTKWETWGSTGRDLLVYERDASARWWLN